MNNGTGTRLGHWCWLPAASRVNPGGTEWWMVRCERPPTEVETQKIHVYYQWSARRDVVRISEVSLDGPHADYPQQVANGVVPQVDVNAFFRGGRQSS